MKCLFCNGFVEIKTTSAHSHYAKCPMCLASGPRASSPSEALWLWDIPNKREARTQKRLDEYIKDHSK